MKNLRRLFVALTVLMLALLCLTATVQAAEIVDSGKCGDNLTWTLDDEGTLTISGEGKMYNYESDIPPWQELDVRKAVVESGVTTIGAYAFEPFNDFLSELTQISLPSTLKEIGSRAFASSHIQQIKIPNSVTKISKYAFEGSHLTSVTWPKGTKVVESSVFQWCDYLEEVVLPEGVTEIGFAAFRDCIKLENISIPSTLKVIEDSAFFGCKALQAAALPDSVTTIESSVFENCTNLQVVYLPQNLTTIRFALFRGCSSLQMVVLPEKLTTIESNAFKACVALREVYFPGTEKQLEQIEVAGGNDPLAYAGVYLITLITKEPEDAHVLEGTTVKFSTDTNRDGSTYQWYYLAPGADEWKVCKQTGAKTKTLTVTATKDLDGYYFCCEITDVFGGVGQTRAAQLTIVKPPEITTQPKNAAAPEGSTAKVTVKVKGDGLKYQWYFKNPGGSKFSKSSTTSATYSVKMSEKADGREVYCVITDKYGQTVKTKTVTLYMGNPAKITTQPKTAVAAEGKVAKTTVKASGDGLTYQWYFKNPGGSKFSKSSTTSATYSVKMSEKADGREVYCVITDQYGTSVKTDTVPIYMGNPAKITTQPKTAVAAEGKIAKTTVKASGDGLTYQWYFKNLGGSKFRKSSTTSATYSVKMSEEADGREVYCVITDQYGTSVQTKTVTIYMGNPAKITTQPKTAVAAEGKIAKTTVKASGDGLTYQWYFKNPGGSKFRKSSTTSATYSVKMSEEAGGREVYCVITDQYGTSVQTKTVTIYMGNPAKITTQPKSVVAAEGKTAKTTVKASGDGLTYQWYFKNLGGSKFRKSSITSATYSVKMSEEADGREVYCVITDKYGTSVQTKTITLTLES